jgi:hypothetical protein
MILLVHLDGCTCPDEEAILSKDLIDQVFSLRLGHILNGGASINLRTPRFNNLGQHNSRYSALITMKTRVWQKLSWSTPYSPHPQDGLGGELGGVNPPDGAALQVNPDVDFGYEYPVEDSSVSSLWDEFTAGASLDAGISDWDEWNLLSAGLFTE